MSIKRSIVATAAVAAVGLVLAGCAGAGTSAGSATPSTDTINTELWYAPTQFDPALASGSSDVSVARLGFDTLLRYGDSGLIGGLATDWKATSSSDYTFTIRKDATCSDGTPITPSVVAASLQYLTGNTNAAARSTAQTVFGRGTPTFAADDAAGVVKITLSTSYSELFAGLATEQTGIICPAGLADPAGLAAGKVAGAWSGPYVLDSFSAGVSAAYTLRGDYNAWPNWGSSVQGTPAKKINITVSADANTSANLLASGGIDIARFYDSNAQRFANQAGYTTVTMPDSAYTLVFNEIPGTGSVFTDKALRVAVAHAIDTQGFNQAGLDGLGAPLTTVTASTVACALDGSKLVQSYDPSAASALAGVKIRLLAMSNWNPAIDFLAESLRSAGATVEVSALDPADWKSQMRSQPEKWDLALNATGVAGPISKAIASYVGPTAAQGGRNVSGADDAAGYAALQAGLAASDKSAQCASFEDAQRSILDRVDMTPLITGMHFAVSRPGFASSVFSGYWDISSMRVTG